MDKLLEEILEVTVHKSHENLKSVPWVVLDDYNENVEQFGEGKPILKSESILVTIYTRDVSQRDALVKKVVEFATKTGNSFPEVEKYYDTMAKLYRGDIKFKQIV